MRKEGSLPMSVRLESWRNLRRSTKVWGPPMRVISVEISWGT